MFECCAVLFYNYASNLVIVPKQSMYLTLAISLALLSPILVLLICSTRGFKQLNFVKKVGLTITLSGVITGFGLSAARILGACNNYRGLIDGKIITCGVKTEHFRVDRVFTHEEATQLVRSAVPQLTVNLPSKLSEFIFTRVNARIEDLALDITSRTSLVNEKLNLIVETAKSSYVLPKRSVG